MITLQNTENALKTIYLGAMTELLNTKVNPFLTKVKQSTADVWGKEICRFVDDDEQRIQFVSTLKNLYGQIEISDKALHAAANGKTMFVDLLDAELQSLLKASRFNLSKMIYGDGTQEQEMRGVQGLTGIGAIFDMSKPLYGKERNVSPIMQPLIQEATELSDVVIEQAIDKLSDRGARTDFIAVSRDIKYEYIERHKNIDVVEMDGGFKAISHNGIPIMADKFIPQGTMYLLDTSMFTLHQLCDWRWLEDERGKILRQDEEGTYKATLVKYADLMCDRPDRQGMIKIKE